MKKFFNSFIFAFRGFVTTWREEQNFRVEILAGLFVVFSIFYFKFSFVESAFCILAITIVLSAEIINTAIEDLCNKIEPNQDPIIGKIKDIAGAFVLVSSIGAFIIGVLIFWHHFM